MDVSSSILEGKLRHRVNKSEKKNVSFLPSDQFTLFMIPIPD